LGSQDLRVKVISNGNKKNGLGNMKTISKELVTFVISRDNFKCTVCGKAERLVVHHKDNSRKTGNINNNLDNLITLCYRCHGLEHNKEAHEKVLLKVEKIRLMLESGMGWKEIAKNFKVTKQRVNGLYFSIKNNRSQNKNCFQVPIDNTASGTKLDIVRNY
jgi:hypothetical protein